MSDPTRVTTRCAACGCVVYADALRCKHCLVDRATMIGATDCMGCGDPAPPIGLACPRCGTTRQPTGVRGRGPALPVLRWASTRERRPVQALRSRARAHRAVLMASTSVPGGTRPSRILTG